MNSCRFFSFPLLSLCCSLFSLAEQQEFVLIRDMGSRICKEKKIIEERVNFCLYLINKNSFERLNLSNMK